MNKRQAKEMASVCGTLALVLAMIVAPTWWWISSWLDCRKVHGILVKDGCGMPACVEYKQGGTK